jgi:hypothetical protein
MDNRFSFKITVKIFCFIFLFPAFYVEAQDINKLKQDFPGAGAVYLSKEVHAFFDRKGETVSLYTKNKTTTLFLDDNANLYTDKNIFYSGLILVDNIDAKTVVVENEKEKNFRSSKIIEKDVVEPGIFYDDMKMKEVVFPNIKKGAKAILSFDNTYMEHRLFGPVVLSSYIPVIESVCKVTVHKDIKIKYHYIGIDESSLSFSMVEKGDEITYTWIAKNLPAQKRVVNGPNIRYYEPQIVIYVASLIVKEGVINFADNKQGLANWCSGFLKNINEHNEILLKPSLDSIIKGAKTDIEKSQKIFYWVQDNVKYIAFEDGYSGYIPRNAIDVYTKRYGDCKDMANLITTLHKMAGLEAYHTWIGTRDIPYKIENMPMPCNFNHMICSAKIENKWYFLDATGRNIPYGFPSSMIQSKEGLLNISKDSSVILNVPEVDYDRNVTRDDIEIYINDKTIEGKGSKTLKGFSMVSSVVPMSYKSKEDRDVYLKKLLSLGNNKCSVNNIVIPENGGYKLPEYKFQYQFILPDYILNLTSEIYVNLNIHKNYTEDKIDVLARKVAYELDFKQTIEQRVILTIPEGYVATYIPDSYVFDDIDFGFIISYEKAEDKIVLNKKLYTNFLLLTPDKFDKWNQMITKLNKAYKETVALKKL